MALIAVNRDYTYSPAAFEHRPQKDVSLELDLPSWWDDVEVSRVEEHECVPIPAQGNGDALTFTLPEIEIGEMILVRPRGPASS